MSISNAVQPILEVILQHTWCDKLASVPAIGIRFPPRFMSSAVMLERLSPLLATWVQNNKAIFTIQKQDSFGVEILTEDGFLYGLNSDSAFVSFQHRMKLKNNSAAAPTLEMLSRPLPYTELVDALTYRLRDVLLRLDPKSEGVVERVGLVSTTNVAEEDAPPGLLLLLAYIGRPWKGTPASFDISFTAVLSNAEKHQDRCIHHLIRPDEDNSLITAKFDWQRIYTEPRSLRALDEMLTSVRDGAIAYFEDIAEGGRFAID